MEKIIIIGGGFGGIAAASKLIQNKKSVTIISESDHFLFTPLLHEAAAGELSVDNIAICLRNIFKGTDIRLIKSKVEKIDLTKRIVHYGKEKLNYTTLIISTGSQVNYYGIKGAEEFTFNLKKKHDVLKLRESVRESLERASATKNKKEIEKSLTFVVVGAGPTGIEYIGDLAGYLAKEKQHYPVLKKYSPKLFLVNAAKEILPLMDQKSKSFVLKRLSNIGVTLLNESLVSEVGEGFVVLPGYKRIYSGTIVWSAGVKPSTLVTVPRIQDERGYFYVDNYLKISGQDNVYAIGDSAFMKGVPQLAQSAIAQGNAAADNILRKLEGKNQKSFNFRSKGILVSIGKYFAVGELYFLGRKISISGFIPRVMKRLTYLYNLPTMKAKIDVLHEWVVNSFN